MSDGVTNERNVRSSEPVLCVNNCGFYGNPKTENYCSKCFQLQMKKAENKDSPSTSTTPAASPAAAPSSPASTLTIPPISNDEQTTSPTTSAPATASPTSESTPAAKTEKRNRCFSCKKKVGVLGFECRCNNVFCGDHRLAQFHDCPYDMKKHIQEQLRKNNPKVETAKIEKI